MALLLRARSIYFSLIVIDDHLVVAPRLTDTSPTKETRLDATTPESSQTANSGIPVGRV